MKTLIALLFSLILMGGSTQTFAGELTEYESLLLETYMVDKSARPAVIEAYWLNMAERVAVTREELPARVHQNVMLVGIILEGTTLTYTYFVNNPNHDLSAVKEILLSQVCTDPQVSLMLITFEGDVNYVHFLIDDLRNVWDEFHIDSSDCGVGF